MRRLSRRWNATLPTVDDVAEWQAYAVRSASQEEMDRNEGAVDSLRLLFHGRWGNYVLQLINMFHLATSDNIGMLYLYRTELFQFNDNDNIGGINVVGVEQPDPAGRTSLVGNYFDHTLFGTLSDGLNSNTRRDIAQRFVLPLLVGLQQTPQVDPDDLVIHIRSGDIFEGVDGEGGASFGGMIYTQPPLSFYQAVVQRFFKQKQGTVVIIAENALNPVIIPLVQYLDRNGYGVTLRLNQSLTTDLSWLLSARNLVLANGTIGVAVALLSRVIETAYFFRHDGTGLNLPVDEFLGDHLTKYFVVDKDFGYIPTDGWGNTAQQRRDMVDFSIDRLFWEDGFPMGSMPATASSAPGDAAVSLQTRDLFDHWIGDDGRRYADAVAKMTETTSAFSTFRRNPALKTVMEHLTEQQGRDYLKVIKDDDVLAVLHDSELADRIGAPETFDYDGRRLAPATLRYASVLQMLLECFPGFADIRSAIEIGAGYGGQARVLSDYIRRTNGALEHYSLVDIDPVTRLARCYLDNFVIRPACDFITRSEINRAGAWDLAISNFAFSMFSRELQLDYIGLVFKRCRAGYLTMNTGLDGHPNWGGGMSAAELLEILPNCALRREDPRTGDGNYILVFGEHQGDIGLTLSDF